MNPGKKLEHVLVDRGLNAKSLAEKADMAASTVGRVIDSPWGAEVGTLWAIACALDIGLDWLLDDTQPYVHPEHPRVVLSDPRVRQLDGDIPPDVPIEPIRLAVAEAVAAYRRQQAAGTADRAGALGQAMEVDLTRAQRRKARRPAQR